MSFINSRLRRLEEHISGGGPCPVCGDSPPSPKMIPRYAEDIPEHLRFSPDAEIPEGEQFCPECGRQRWVILEMVYEGTEEGEGTE